MKKLLLIFLIMFLSLQANAFEDYILVSDKPVKSVFSSDEKILSVVPFFTINNDKKMILVRIKSFGKARIDISTIDGVKNIEVESNETNTILSKEDGFSVFALDKPKE